MAKAKRNVGLEILRGIREINRGEHGRVITVPSVASVRESTGLSQSQFARLLGVSVRTLQEWEQGRRAPSGAARTLLLIAARQCGQGACPGTYWQPPRPRAPDQAAPTLRRRGSAYAWGPLKRWKMRPRSVDAATPRRPSMQFREESRGIRRRVPLLLPSSTSQTPRASESAQGASRDLNAEEPAR